MSVVIRKKVLIDGTETELKTYQPPGKLSKTERERADRLDEVIKTKIATLAQKLVTSGPKAQVGVRKWYLLGQSLRALVDDSSLVSSNDISGGLIWEATWYYLPNSLRPANSGEAGNYSDKLHKRKDHLSLCYEISAFDWDEVQWIQRWDDWHQLAFRPGLLRDHRIVRALGKGISTMTTYPTREKFRDMVKKLGDAFPTRQHRDSSFLSDDVLEKEVADALGA